MDVKAAAKLLLPRLPLLLKTGLWHSLSLSPESGKWDLRTELIVTTLRNIMSQSTSSITQAQRFSLRDPGVKGQIWVLPISLKIKAAEDEIRQLLFRVIEDLNETGDEVYDRCTLETVEAEWTAHRPNVPPDEPVPTDMPSAQLYERLMGDVETLGTVLYFHGGAHYLCDPASHRQSVSQLCKAASNSRALNVRYRLAPKHPFPAAILDCLVSYLSLLYPPPGSLHAAVKPEKVVFAGDSAGGNICMSLLAFLLHLQHTVRPEENKTIRFNDCFVPLPLPLPGGVATNAAWTDITRAMPSITTNWHWDYLPYPTISLTSERTRSAKSSLSADSPVLFNTSPTTARSVRDFNLVPRANLPPHRHQPGETPNPFPCDLWPGIPPRADLYTAGESLCHPLVSPSILPAEAWRDSCPLFFECGEEMLADEVQTMARRTSSVGVKVFWIGFEAMPHCFAQILAGTSVARKGMDVWGQWIGHVFQGKELKTQGVWVEARTLNEQDVDIHHLNEDLTDEEIFARMRHEQKRRCEAFRYLVNEPRDRASSSGARL